MASPGTLLSYATYVDADVTTLPVLTDHDFAQQGYYYSADDLMLAAWQWTPTSTEQIIFDTLLSYDPEAEAGVATLAQLGLIDPEGVVNIVGAAFDPTGYKIQVALQAKYTGSAIGLVAYGALYILDANGSPVSVSERPMQLVMRANDYGSESLWDAPVGGLVDPGEPPVVVVPNYNNIRPGRRAFT